MSVSATARVAALLPGILTFAISHRRLSADRMVAQGLRLGGIFAWGVEQGRFAGELLTPELAHAFGKAMRTSRQPPGISGMTVLQALPVADSSIASFKVTGEAGESLTLLLGLPEENDKLSADAKLAEFLVGMLPKHSQHISKADLVKLIEDVALAATLDGSLAEEANGLRYATQTERFDAPQIVRQSEQGFLIETDLVGLLIEDLTDAERSAAYGNAIGNWSRMLIHDGILNVTLRCDRLRVRETQLGLTRWAGTRQASSASAALVRNLVLAAFGCGAAVQARARDQARRLLSEGLGMEGSLSGVETFCLSLISENGQLSLGRKNLSRIVARQSDRYRSAERVEIFQLLRQLVWLRDLGLACGASDLAGPWRELVPELDDDV
jgi:hypothetical protein